MKDLLKNLGIDKLASSEASQSKLGGLLGAGALGGLLGALLGGSGIVKKAAKNAVAVGLGATTAALAYKMYQKWSQNRQDVEQQPGSSIDSIFDSFNAKSAASSLSNDKISLLIVKACVFAARADGHIDEQEKQEILNATGHLSKNPDYNQMIASCLNCKLDPNDFAKENLDIEFKYDLYRLSHSIIIADTKAEIDYLNALAAALNLNEQVRKNLDLEVKQLQLKN